MTFGSTFGRTFSPTFQPSSQAPAAASSWWLAGGIAATDCVGAYNAKGVADIGSAYVNLNNPGTYNLTTAAAPDWDATNGFKFAAAAKKHLYLPCSLSGLGSNNQNWSLIMKYSNFTSNGASGTFIGYYNNYAGGGNASIRLEGYLSSRQYWYNGGSKSLADVLTTPASGVFSFRGNTAYLDGTSKGTISTSTGSFTASGLGIGALFTTDAGYSNWSNIYIQQIAFYKTAISEGQHAAVLAAIEAL